MHLATLYMHSVGEIIPSPISMRQSNESGDDSMSIDSSAGGGLTNERTIGFSRVCEWGC